MRVPSGCSKLDTITIIDKVKGLIFGAILGDSLGLATEGLSKLEIEQMYGQGPIRFGMDEDGIPFHPDQLGSAIEENDFGDDAEQILLMMDSILETRGRFLSKNFATKFLEYSKNGIKYLNKLPNNLNQVHQAVLTNPNYTSSPQLAAVEVWQSSQVKKDTNGALVRAPLLGVLQFWDGTTVIENSTECCRLTHPDPRCMISCIIASTIIARLLRGQDLEIEIANHSPTSSQHSSFSDDDSPQFIDTLPAHDRLEALVRNVIETNIKSMRITSQNTKDMFIPSDFDTILKKYDDQLLLSGRSEDSLGIALYCLTRYVPPHSETEYFKKMLMDVVMQGGDSDIHGSVVGAMLGARFGYSQLPSEWVVGMKRWEWLEDRVEEFCSLL